MKPIVSIRNMYKSFFGVIAMDGMDFDVYEGEIRCLIGENGCGKSSMIKVISGYYPYDQGELFIHGKPYAKINPSESMREGIQVIYQDFSLFPNMTIAENIMMYDSVGSKRPIVHWKELYARAKETLVKIHFSIDPSKYVYQLSIAETQMVAICRAIAQDAKLIIMDEPTTALTTNEVEKLFDVVKALKNHGVAVLFVSHKLDEILEICDTITVMRNGRNVFEMQAYDPKPAKEDLIFHMTGKRFKQGNFDFQPFENSVPLLEVKGFSKANAFHDVHLSLYGGEILGITGLLGCGRQELAEVLFGVDMPTSGAVFIDGKDVGVFRSVQDALRHRIAYVPEDRLIKGLHLEQSIANNAISRIIGQLANRYGFLNRSLVETKKKDVLSSVHISGMLPNNPVKSLSGGNQQKVGLVKWLASNPRILILNCPTVGVDVGAKDEIHTIIKSLAQNGIGVIVISDDIPEVMQLCNRVLVMKNGHISDELSIKETTMEALEALLAEEELQKGGMAHGEG